MNVFVYLQNFLFQPDIDFTYGTSTEQETSWYPTWGNILFTLQIKLGYGQKNHPLKLLSIIILCVHTKSGLFVYIFI